MKSEYENRLLTELLRQLQLFQHIYQATASLVAVCAGDQPDQAELDRLLSARQQLMNETIDSQCKMQEITLETQADLSTPIIQNVLLEIRSVLQKTAFLDEAARKGLAGKRDRVKHDLVRLQKGKKAGAAYTVPVLQSEGFFIDSRKN